MLLSLRCFFWFFFFFLPSFVSLVFSHFSVFIAASLPRALLEKDCMFSLIYLFSPCVFAANFCHHVFMMFFSFPFLSFFKIKVLHLLFCLFVFFKSVSCVWVFVLTIFNIYDLGQFLHGWSSQCCCPMPVCLCFSTSQNNSSYIVVSLLVPMALNPQWLQI